MANDVTRMPPLSNRGRKECRVLLTQAIELLEAVHQVHLDEGAFHGNETWLRKAAALQALRDRWMVVVPTTLAERREFAEAELAEIAALEAKA